MKLRFFGDSWYWSWYYQKPFRSNIVRSYLHENTGLPTLEAFFNQFGIDCYHENEPGCTFYRTVDKITKECAIDPTVDYNVVFFSNLIRGDNFSEHCFDLTSYDKFMEKWQKDCFDLLSALDIWSRAYNQKIILIGGQCTIPLDIYKMVRPRPNLFLLADCIISKLAREYAGIDIKQSFGIFKCSQDFSPFVDKTWDKRLIDHIYNDQQYYDQIMNKEFFTRDHYHLSAIGHVYLTDMILDKIEHLEGRK